MNEKATAKDLDRLVNLLLTDADFRRRFAQNKAKALKSVDLPNAIEQLEAVNNVDYRALQRLAEAFGFEWGTDSIIN